MGEHGALERLQLGTRFQTDLLGQDGSGMAVGAQCVALTPAPEQGEDQLGVEPLPQRMGADQLGQGAEHFSVVTRRQLGVDETLVRRDHELVEAGPGLVREPMIEHIDEGWSADQADR